MSEFDDPQMENLLGRAAGAFPDVNTAFVRVQGRVRTVKRRRMVVTSAAACGVLFAGALFAGMSSDSRDRLQPSGTGSGVVSDSDTDSTDSSTSATEPGTTDVDATTGTVASSTVSTVTGTVTVTVPGQGSVPGSAPGTSTATTNPPATNPPATVTKVFSGEGGSITVRLQGGSLTLVTYSAVAGFDVQVQHSSGDRVEVRFESAQHRTRIRIDLESGEMVPTILDEDI